MSDRLLVGTHKGLFVMERAGRGWSTASVSFLGMPISMALFDERDGALYAALKHEHSGVKLHSSRDGGATWQELSAPAFDRHEPAQGAASNDTDKKPSRISLIWSLEAGGKDQPGVLWAGTLPCGLFKSEDSGKSWKFIRGFCDHAERKDRSDEGADLSGVHSICVNPRNSQNIIVGASRGGVWASSDGGQTWECRVTGIGAKEIQAQQRDSQTIQDLHRLVRCHSAPDVLWAQHRCGVFRTADAGVSWQSIPEAGPSTFGFALAVHPRHPETAWVVPVTSDEMRVPVDAHFVVARTRDAGKTFEILSDGLPKESAYDIVDRHAMDVDESGKRLAVGSTTGGLWTTNNGGESWRVLPTRFPPIHCLRFSK